MTSKITEHDLNFLIHIGKITNQEKKAKQLQTAFNKLSEIKKGMIWGLDRKKSSYSEYARKVIEDPNYYEGMYPVNWCWCPCYANVMVSCPYCTVMFKEYKKIDGKANELATDIYNNSK